jgi:AcrR family transcriptional regulator
MVLLCCASVLDLSLHYRQKGGESNFFVAEAWVGAPSRLDKRRQPVYLDRTEQSLRIFLKGPTMNTTSPDKRTKILAAAMQLIAKNGFHGAPTAMIAAEAGVGTGTLYRYFADKDALIIEIQRDIESRLHQRLQDDYPLGAPIRQRLDHYYIGLIRFFIDQPLEFKFLGQFYDSPYGVELRRDKIFSKPAGDSGCETIRSLLVRGTEEGIIKDFPLVLLFALFIGPLTAAVRDHILGFIDLEDGLQHQLADAFWDAIRR